MKEIKWLLGVLLGASYVGLWWLATIFNQSPLVGIPTVMTVVMFIASCVYLKAHWDD